MDGVEFPVLEAISREVKVCKLACGHSRCPGQKRLAGVMKEQVDGNLPFQKGVERCSKERAETIANPILSPHNRVVSFSCISVV